VKALTNAGHLVTTVFLVAWFTMETASAQADDPLSMAKAAILAHQANLHGFPTYKCRFASTRALADSSQEALRGKYDNARQCDFLLVLDGDKEKYECYATGEVKPPKKADGLRGPMESGSVDFIPIANLRLGDQALHYFSPWRSADICVKGTYRANVIDSPLFMEFMGPRQVFAPVTLLQQCDTGDMLLTAEGLTVLDEQPVVHARLTSKLSKSLNYEYYFDVRRGYLPLRVVRRVYPPETAQQYDRVTYLLDAKECSKGRWFPMHTVTVFVQPTQKRVDITEIRVKELDVENKPTTEDFTLELPAGTKIERPNEDPEYRSFRLRRNERITPDDIPRLLRMLDAVGSVPLMDTSVRRDSINNLTNWSLMGGGLVVCCASVYMYRRLGRKAVG